MPSLTLVDITNLAPRVKRYVRNCPDVMVNQALSDAARVFFARSRAWRMDVPLTFLEGVYTVPLALSVNNEPLDWLDIHLATLDNGTHLKPGNLRGFNSAEWDDSGPGPPVVYGSIDGKCVTIYPKPDTDYYVQLSVSVQPSLDGTHIPDVMRDRYGQTIAHGAAADLLTMEGYEFFNPNMAPPHERHFAAGISQAVADQNTSRTIASSMVTMRPMA